MTTNQDARAAESVALREAIRGVTSVSFGLLRECLGPLEVSAALIESDDSEQLDALIDKVRAALAAYDAAQSEPAVVAESAEQRAVPAGFVLSRATDLHEKAGMPWWGAEELALSEAGIDEAGIDELIGECGYAGLESLLTCADELRQFTRSILVHQHLAAAPAAQQAAPSNLQLREGGERG